MDISWEQIAAQLQRQVADLSLQLAVARAETAAHAVAAADEREDRTDG